MAHIELTSPVAHIWFLKSVPISCWSHARYPSKKNSIKLSALLPTSSSMYTKITEKMHSHLSGIDLSRLVLRCKKEFQGMLNEAKIAQSRRNEAKKHSMKWSVTAQINLMNSMQSIVKWKKNPSTYFGTVISELDYRLLMGVSASVCRWHRCRGYSSAPRSCRSSGTHQNIQKEIKTTLNQRKTPPETPVSLSISFRVINIHEISSWKLSRFFLLISDRWSNSMADVWLLQIWTVSTVVSSTEIIVSKLIQLGAPEVILKMKNVCSRNQSMSLISGSVRSSRSGYAMANKRKLKSLTDILKG